MPRSKASDKPQQRLSPRAPLHPLTTSSAESNGAHRAFVRDRSPKLEDHRHSLSEVGVCSQKKRRTRVFDLETRLGHAKEELKKLKEQLTSVENAKRDAQQELEETKKLIAFKQEQQEEQNGGEVEEVIDPVPEEVEIAPPTKQESKVPVASVVSNVDDGVVVGVGVGEANVATEEVLEERIDGVEVKKGVKDGSVAEYDDPDGGCKEEESLVTAPALDVDEVLVVEDKLVKEEDEIKRYIAQNAALKKELEELKKVAAAAKSKEEETGVKMRSLAEEVDESRGRSGGVEEHLEAVEAEKAQMEAELERLRIQTEQWRKAADAAVAIISADGCRGGDAGAGRRMPERCASMDKQLGGGVYFGSPMVNGRRKSGGIRMLGGLWKKRW